MPQKREQYNTQETTMSRKTMFHIGKKMKCESCKKDRKFYFSKADAKPTCFTCGNAQDLKDGKAAAQIIEALKEELRDVVREKMTHQHRGIYSFVVRTESETKESYKVTYSLLINIGDDDSKRIRVSIQRSTWHTKRNIGKPYDKSLLSFVGEKFLDYLAVYGLNRVLLNYEYYKLHASETINEKKTIPSAVYFNGMRTDIKQLMPIEDFRLLQEYEKDRESVCLVVQHDSSLLLIESDKFSDKMNRLDLETYDCIYSKVIHDMRRVGGIVIKEGYDTTSEVANEQFSEELARHTVVATEKHMKRFHMNMTKEEHDSIVNDSYIEYLLFLTEFVCQLDNTLG